MAGLDASKPLNGALMPWALTLLQPRASLLSSVYVCTCVSYGWIFSFYVVTHTESQAPGVMAAKKHLPQHCFIGLSGSCGLCQGKKPWSGSLSLSVSWAPLCQAELLPHPTLHLCREEHHLLWTLCPILDFPLQTWIRGGGRREREESSVTKSMSNKC